MTEKEIKPSNTHHEQKPGGQHFDEKPDRGNHDFKPLPGFWRDGMQIKKKGITAHDVKQDLLDSQGGE